MSTYRISATPIDIRSSGKSPAGTVSASSAPKIHLLAENSRAQENRSNPLTLNSFQPKIAKNATPHLKQTHFPAAMNIRNRNIPNPYGHSRPSRRLASSGFLHSEKLALIGLFRLFPAPKPIHALATPRHTPL
jgi:hypothetical protein